MTDQELIAKYFPGDLKKKADELVKKYEGDKRAPLLEILHILMEEHDHLTLEVEAAAAAYLELPPIQVREVVTFYTLYYTKKRAKKRFNVCRTLSCALMGANDIVKHLEDKLGVRSGTQSEDGACSLQEVECLGACEIAPMMQVDDDEYVGNLTREKIDELLSTAPGTKGTG